MSNWKNKIIHKIIQSMEQGEFQCLCLDFLSTYDSKYKDLKRFGHTPEGKTRKGIPDLIATLSDGSIVAVECSTEKDYWKKITDIEKWKPCKDIISCINKIGKTLNEIILCSNQEQPTNKPNLSPEIINYAKEISPLNILISIYNSAKIEKIISDNLSNPLFKEVIKKYFHELFEVVYGIEEERLVSFQQKMKEITKNVFHEFIEEEKLVLKTKKNLEETKYLRTELPSPGEITRKIPDNFPFLNPIKSIFTLLGIPKIGKTSLISSFAKIWQKQQIEVKWYDSPSNITEINEMTNALCMNIFKKYLIPKEYSELKENKISFYSLEKEHIIQKNPNPIIYIIDNAEFLINEDKSILKICEILEKIQSLEISSNLGFIFISNRSLKDNCPIISKEVNTPLWTKDEILKFLSIKISDSDYYKNDSYMDIIMTKCHSHPLVALALAKKYKTVEELILSIINMDQNVNKELQAEVKKLLFQDILENNDLKNFVLRLSPLIYPFNEEIFEVISNITPLISYPYKLILEKLVGPVIEGNEKSGYTISSIYKSIAQEYLTTPQKNEIFERVSEKLLKLKGNRLDDRTIDGIIYAFYAGKFEAAFYWTTRILTIMNNKNLSQIQKNMVVSHLELISFWNASKELKLLIKYYIMLIAMAMTYVSLKNNKKAINKLNKVVMPVEDIEDKKLKDGFLLTIEIAKYYKMLLYAQENDIKNILETLNNLDFNVLKNILPEKDSNLILFFKETVSVVSIKQIPSTLIEKIINCADLHSEQDIANLIIIASHFGTKIDKEEISLDKFVNLLPQENPISKIVENIIRAQYAFQKQNLEESLKYLDMAISLCKQDRLWSKLVKSSISQMQGDAYYLMHDNRNAKKAYLKFLRYLPRNTKREFIYGWSNYRVGLLSDNAKKAVAYFKKSSIIFNQFKYEDLCARSEGERGVALIQLGEQYKFIRIVEWMAKQYFLRKRMNIGPAVMVGLAQLIRIQSILNNTPLIESDEKVYPEFNRRVYAGVSIEAKPQGSGIIAFYSLANTYSALGCSERKIKSLRIALSFKPTNSIEFNSKVFVCNELLMEIVQLGSIEEIFNIIINVILIEPKKVRSGLQNLSSCAFRAIDKNISFLKDSRKFDLLKLCSKIEDHLTKLQYTNLDWWLAEIYLIQAKLSLDIIDRNQQYSYWSKAYKHGINSSNQNVIIESAHSISFIYPDFSESIISVAEKQFSIVKGISTQDCNYERLEGIGINLFNGWSNLDWRRESTYDLKAKYALMDGAKELKKANFSAHQASPIMILLLCSVFDFQNKVTELAKNAISKEIINNIPNFVRDKIKDYL